MFSLLFLFLISTSTALLDFEPTSERPSDVNGNGNVLMQCAFFVINSGDFLARIRAVQCQRLARLRFRVYSAFKVFFVLFKTVNWTRSNSPKYDYSQNTVNRHCR